jgi:hypothetical protein
MDAIVSLQIGFAVEALDSFPRTSATGNRTDIYSSLTPGGELTLKHSVTGQENGLAGLASNMAEEGCRSSDMVDPISQ